MPYLMARRSQSRTARNNNRALLIATVAVIILMAGTVTGLAYGIRAAKDHSLSDRLNTPSVAEGAPQSRIATPLPSPQPD